MKTYYKITDNTPDEWEIVKTNDKQGDTYESFSSAKKELLEILQAAMQAEKEAIKAVKNLKIEDIKSETNKFYF